MDMIRTCLGMLQNTVFETGDREKQEHPDILSVTQECHQEGKLKKPRYLVIS